MRRKRRKTTPDIDPAWASALARWVDHAPDGAEEIEGVRRKTLAWLAGGGEALEQVREELAALRMREEELIHEAQEMARTSLADIEGAAMGAQQAHDAAAQVVAQLRNHADEVAESARRAHEEADAAARAGGEITRIIEQAQAALSAHAESAAGAMDELNTVVQAARADRAAYETEIQEALTVASAASARAMAEEAAAHEEIGQLTDQARAQAQALTEQSEHFSALAEGATARLGEEATAWTAARTAAMEQIDQARSQSDAHAQEMTTQAQLIAQIAAEAAEHIAQVHGARADLEDAHAALVALEEDLHRRTGEIVTRTEVSDEALRQAAALRERTAQLAEHTGSDAQRISEALARVESDVARATAAVAEAQDAAAVARSEASDGTRAIASVVARAHELAEEVHSAQGALAAEASRIDEGLERLRAAQTAHADWAEDRNRLRDAADQAEQRARELERKTALLDERLAEIEALGARYGARLEVLEARLAAGTER